MITRAIKTAIAERERKQWEKTYWAVDIHGTMIVPNYVGGVLPEQFYPYAKEVMQRISKREEVTLILYTCSHPHEVEKYLDFFKAHDIHFSYANQNPEAENTAYGCYEHKPYFNVLFEDKCGFDPEQDWKNVANLLDELGWH